MKTLKDLEQQAARASDTQRARLKRNYHLARRLGFSSREAVVLQSWKEEAIRRLAAEKNQTRQDPPPSP